MYLTRTTVILSFAVPPLKDITRSIDSKGTLDMTPLCGQKEVHDSRKTDNNKDHMQCLLLPLGSSSRRVGNPEICTVEEADVHSRSLVVNEGCQ